MNAEQILNIGKTLEVGQINGLVIIVLAIIVCYTIKGGAEGFIRTVFEMFSVLVAAAAASFTAPFINRIWKTDAPLLAFLVGYIVLWLGLKYLCVALDLISKLPVIHELNKAAGILAGLFRGIFVVWVLFIVITVFRTTSWGEAAMELIEESKILMRLYESNLLLKLAGLFF